jgi:hypothetical protein
MSKIQSLQSVNMCGDNSVNSVGLLSNVLKNMFFL